MTTTLTVPLQGIWTYAVGSVAARPGPGNVIADDPEATVIVVDRFDARGVAEMFPLVGWAVFLTQADGAQWDGYTIDSVSDLGGYAELAVSPLAGWGSPTPVAPGPVQSAMFDASWLASGEMVKPTLGVVWQGTPTIRYADIDVIKDRLGIDTADTAWDVQITQATIAGETAIDEHLGRSLADPQPFGEVFSIPDGMRQAAENVAIAVFKATDTPGGVGGSDGWFGELDLSEVARQEIRRSPTLLGLKRGFGVA